MKVTLTPEGFAWHQNSCAYDALLSIVYCFWFANQSYWTQHFTEMNHDFLGNLATGFQKQNANYDEITVESVRDNFRRKLNTMFPTMFPWGFFTSPCEIMPYLFSMPIQTTTTLLICDNGHTRPDATRVNNTCCVLSAGTGYGSVQEWMDQLQDKTCHTCTGCLESTSTTCTMYRQSQFTHVLPLIGLDFSNKKIQIDHSFTIMVDAHNVNYTLCGVMYYGDSHFTSQVIQPNGMVWFHDGYTNGKSMRYDGTLDSLNDNGLTLCRSKMAVAAIYIKAEIFSLRSATCSGGPLPQVMSQCHGVTFLSY